MFDLGTLSNPVVENATLALRYSAVVIDNPGNVRGRGLTNNVTWDWTGGQLIDNAPDGVVVEPTLTLEKDAEPRSLAPGGVVTFTMTVGHPAPPSNSPAFDLVLTDTVPAGMTYVAGSLAASAGGAVDDTAAPASRDLGCAGLECVCHGDIPGDDGLSAGGHTRCNNAYLSWSTLPGDVTAPQSTHNLLSTERVLTNLRSMPVWSTIPALPATGFELVRRPICRLDRRHPSPRPRRPAAGDPGIGCSQQHCRGAVRGGAVGPDLAVERCRASGGHSVSDVAATVR